MTGVEINDKREPKDFVGISFSEYKKTEVQKQLFVSLQSAKSEQASYWAAELICAGHYSDLWDTLLLFYSKHVHLGNPKLSLYLQMRVQDFKNHVSRVEKLSGSASNSGGSTELLGLRNESCIRVLFCEVICMLCISKQKTAYQEIRLTVEDYNLASTEVVHVGRFKAPSSVQWTETGGRILPDDPRPLRIPVHEFSFQLGAMPYEGGKHLMLALYWLEWLVGYENQCRIQKIPCKCERRDWAPVKDKFQMDIVWIVWGIILQEARERKETGVSCAGILLRVLESLMYLYGLRYSSGPSFYKKRRFLIYMAISLLIEPSSSMEAIFSQEIATMEERKSISSMLEYVDSLYLQVKHNEITPATEYLFHNLREMTPYQKKKHLEQKLQYLHGSVPRVSLTTQEVSEEEED